MQVIERKNFRGEEPQEVKLVGSRVLRVEDQRLLKGMGQFIDNIKFPQMVFAGFVRSPYAHATIKRIDLSVVEKDPNLVAVLTPDEVKERTNPIPVIWRMPHARLHEHYALAQGKVKHVGDPVIAIASRSLESLEDLLEKVQVDYEQIEPVVDSATAEHQIPIHEEIGSNVCFEVPMSIGDVDKAMQESSTVVSDTFEVSRLAASPIETRGVLANPDGLFGSLTVYSSTQWPHILRTFLSSCLKLPENQVQVIGPDVGGAFGVKGEIYGEEIAIPLLALKCKLPVKWIESRRESFEATTHARSQKIKATASFTKEGKLTGLKVESVCDLGAYLHALTPGTGFITAISLNGPYHLPNFSIVAKGVYTNKVSLSAYRGFGQPEAAFIVERLTSMAAEKLSMDPSELRFRNLIQPNEMPFKTVSGGMYDSGDYPSCLRKAIDLAGYESMISRKRVSRNRERVRGIGISIYPEVSGFAPGFVFELFGVTIGGYESATCRIDPSGRALITTGAFPHGQGLNTVLSQICADELGLRLEEVYAFHGDTRSSPYGQGSFGSRSVAVAGNAALTAARNVKEKMLKLGAFILKLDDISELIVANGFVKSRFNPEKRVSISDIARASYTAHNLPEGMDPGLESTSYFSPVGLTTSYAAHVCEVEVDSETGMVKILKHVSVHDCGREMNPMIVEGQIHGGIAQAIGASLFEEMIYDAKGELLTGSFIDYLLPTANEVPSDMIVSSIEVPTRLNSLGAKGIGESGTIIAPAAIANAIADAIGSQVNIIPMTPERVWKQISQLKKNHV
jgi:carbon-monoxide dehydrogenase large subunit